ncbi:MAG: nitric oxide reductase transcription regulator, partial [Nitrospirae bacterium]|nr:nitric oxide reductase transcription regulator [Nitrospirota bacterium]
TGPTGTTLRDKLNFYERKIIKETLDKYAGNKEEAARELGIDLATLYRKMKRLDIT